MEKKNIDELFREKFKTFREVPDEKVWTAIENSLDKKRKKRVIPLWWQLGGVAAVLAIAFFAFYSLNDSANETPVITNTEKENDTERKRDGFDADLKKDENDALQIPEDTEDAVVNSSEDNDIKNIERYSGSDVDGFSASENSSNVDERKKQEGTPQTPEVNRDAVANSGKERTNKNTNKYSSPKSNEDSFQDKLPNTNVADKDATSTKDKSKKDSGNQFPEKTQLATNETDINETNTDQDQTEDNTSILKKDKTNVEGEGSRDAVAVADAYASKKPDTSKTNTKKNTQNGKVTGQENPKMISENSDNAIAQNNEIDEDATKAADNKKSILEVLEEGEEEEVAEESYSRWSAGPNVAPVYFNAIGEGSPIDPGFSPNAKSGSTNMSYGVSIAYAVTKKLSVRSGIHKAEYGYNTNNVGFSPTLAASTSGELQNIDYADSPENLEASSPNFNLDSTNDVVPEFASLNSTRDGTIDQSFGYLEIPLELDYALIDRRFGVNLVGGISSLFLIDNSVTLNSDELTTEIGEAGNLNNLNFSTNIGFGVNYKFTPKMQLNIEPVFKYQLNTFSNVSGDFRPFSIGVYSGLNFKF